ncbi:MAG: lipoprotein-releasing ABC transporter ATP-binding protein LolD [Succinivibrionaceae bacterium]|nr:lipoprotein-releasing ABC transporter ATP-binding protein LolD [Succinivibrionaceae bacterium]
MSDVILEIRDLRKVYDEGKIRTEVLKGVSLAVREREMLAVTGSSGSGKSTLLHIMGTLDRPTSGSVLFRGEDIGRMGSRQRADFRNMRLGFIYQFHHLLGEFTAEENAAMPLLIRGLKPSEALAQARRMLDKVGLSHRLAHRPSEMSGGERQRVAIARALVNSPDLILADEPTGNLDFRTAEEIFGVMCDMHRELGTSFVVVTHDRALAERFSRRIEIRDGRVACDA